MKIPQTGVVQSDIFISFTHRSDKKIKKAIEALKSKMMSIDGIYNIKDDMRYDDTILELDINSYGRELGFTQKSLTTKLKGYLKTEKISKITNIQGDQVDLKVAISQKNRVENFKSLLISVPNANTKVRLDEIAKISYIKKLTSIKKDDLNRVFSVSANMDKDKVSTGKFYIRDCSNNEKHKR